MHEQSLILTTQVKPDMRTAKIIFKVNSIQIF